MYCAMHDGSSFHLTTSSALILITLVHLANCNYTYYVQSADDNSNHSCVQHQKCNKLGYYVKDSKETFVSNSKVYFDVGKHYLEKTLVIKNVHNLSLLAHGILLWSDSTRPQIICTNPKQLELY